MFYPNDYEKQEDNKPSQIMETHLQDTEPDEEKIIDIPVDKGEENQTKAMTTSSDGEDEIILPPEPELEPPVYGIVGGVTYWGFSQRGESHVNNGTPCQDRCVIDVVNSSPLIVAAIADGVGSCMLSHYGAARATRSAVDYLKKELVLNNDNLDDAYVGNLLRSAMQCACEAVRSEAEEMEQLEYSFQSTLTLAIYDGSTLFFSHAGDDGIVAILNDGTMDLATVRKKGEEASSVFPLQSMDWETRKSTNVSAFIMATDGVLDAFVKGEKEGNRIYYPFIEPAVKPGQFTEAEVKEVADFYYNYMISSDYRTKVTDDLTMVVITNQREIKEDNLPEFNQQAWDKYSAEREAEIKAALYPPIEPYRGSDRESTGTAYEDEERNTASGESSHRPMETEKKKEQSDVSPVNERRYELNKEERRKKNKVSSPKRKHREADYEIDSDENRWVSGIDPIPFVFVLVVMIILIFALYFFL